MKILFLILLLCFSTLYAEKQQALLDSISQHAIRIGSGNITNVYVFVDPMCVHSQGYIGDISHNKKLHEKNSYYIFLYRLERFDSAELIEFIYQDKNPKSALEDIMVRNIEVDTFDVMASEKTLKIIEEIASVGKQLKADHRPFIIKLSNLIVP